MAPDPDAPSRVDPIRREIRHWVVGNIPRDDFSSGEVIYSYLDSRPPIDTGLHRYIFLLFEQPHGRIVFNNIVWTNSSEGRANTHTRDFMRTYSLQLVGGNFYQAEFDGSNLNTEVSQLI